MDGWHRSLSQVPEPRLISVLGGTYVTLAAARFLLLWRTDRRLLDIVATDLLVLLPGVVLVYGGYRLGESDLRPEVHSRIVARTLAGIAVMLGVVGLLAISGLNRPFYTPLAGTALGGVAGFGIGLNEAKALSRAHEAEHHQEELRRERDLRERIVQTSPIGIVIVDADGSVGMANEHAASITGRSREELTDLDSYNARLFEATDGEGNPVEEGVFHEIVSTGEPVYDVDRRITRVDGKRVWLSVNGAPLHDASGAVTSVVFAFQDITDRKQLEKDLTRTVDRLEESNERLEQFAYAASHDLQEPLRMVSSYLQLVEQRYADELDEDGREFIEFAVDGADRMRDMIDGLLQYSRIETKGDPFEQVDLGRVFEDVRSDLEMTIEESDADITAEELPEVHGDRGQLHQVFQNLVSNAIEYSGEEPPNLSVTAERNGTHWTVSVSDEGIGIDPGDTDRVFEVFESLHTPDGQGGTGIGLALSERVVERHGGDIWIDSEPGEGATVSFTLPAGDRDV